MDYLIQEHIDNFLYIDIETLPKGEKMSEDEVRELVPKSYKNKDKIQEWIDNKIEDEYRGRALKSEQGRLYCICYAMNDEPVKTIKFQDEGKMIREFVGDLKKNSYDRTLATCGWVGHNIKGFDIPWLLHRMIKYEVTNILYMIPDNPYHKRAIDTAEKWTATSRSYVSLDTICEFLGLKTKDGIDGSQVYDYYLEGKHEKVYQYCRDDVAERLRPLHNLLIGGNNEA